MWVVHEGDCLDLIPAHVEPGSVDAVVCDPPYSLDLFDNDWDRHANFQQWCEGWARECHAALKPGGHLLAFGATRTFHRLAAGIEDAGFEIRDCLSWMYACLTEDTEVLTADGWKLGIDVEEGELVATWDSESEAIALASVEAKFRRAYSGPMVRFRNADTDQVLTPNHRVFHSLWERTQVDGVRTGDWTDWQVDEADYINRWQRMRLPLAGFCDGPGVGGDDYAALLGWVWTEGGFDPEGCAVRIYQSATANPDHTSEIDALLSRLDVPYRRYERERTYHPASGEARPFTEVCWYFSGDMAHRVQSDLPDKSPTFDLLWRLSLSERRALWDAAMKGDGHTSPEKQAFYSKPVAHLEWAQALLATIGQRGRIGLRSPESGRVGGQVGVTPRSSTELQRRHLRDSEVQYEGDVWCIKVPSGAFVARRAGKVFITGNSGFPKARSVLKPAWEPVIVARKPCVGSAKANVEQFGTGFLQIEECRIPVHADDPVHDAVWTVRESRIRPGTSGFVTSYEPGDQKPTAVEGGRWPANVMLDESAGAILDAEAGDRRGASSNSRSGGYFSGSVGNRSSDESFAMPVAEGYADYGGPSRFFFSGKVRAAERLAGVGSNDHPTLKPIELMRWLCALACPPGGTILDPFTGSGSTGAAATMDGFDFIGCDLEFAPLARRRIEWWSQQHGTVDEILQRNGLSEKAAVEHAAAGQLSLDVPT